MQQQGSNGSGGSEQDRDSVGALIRAVGRRAQPPAEHRQRILAASETVWRRAVARRRWRVRGFAVAAALALATIGLLVMPRLSMWHRPAVVADVAQIVGDVTVLPPTDRDWQLLSAFVDGLPAGSRIRTTAGAGVRLLVRGGTDLRVGADTDITMLDGRRLVLSVGRVYVDTGVGGATGRIAINTSYGQLVDVGTQFEAQVSLGGLRLRVREGAVQLADSASAGGQRCAAGQELRIDTGGRLIRQAIAPFDPQWDWIGVLAQPPKIEGLPLQAFLAWVARETGRPLRYASREHELASSRVILHGSVQDLPPLQALEVVLASTDFSYTIQPEGTIVVAQASAAGTGFWRGGQGRSERARVGTVDCGG
jgi:hypothetical protein